MITYIANNICYPLVLNDRNLLSNENIVAFRKTNTYGKLHFQIFVFFRNVLNTLYPYRILNQMGWKGKDKILIFTERNRGCLINMAVLT